MNVWRLLLTLQNEGGELCQPISPLEGEMPGRAEGGASRFRQTGIALALQIHQRDTTQRQNTTNNAERAGNFAEP
jgi:hypothetical protein